MRTSASDTRIRERELKTPPENIIESGVKVIFAGKDAQMLGYIPIRRIFSAILSAIRGKYFPLGGLKFTE